MAHSQSIEKRTNLALKAWKWIKLNFPSPRFLSHEVGTAPSKTFRRFVSSIIYELLFETQQRTILVLFSLSLQNYKFSFKFQRSSHRDKQPARREKRKQGNEAKRVPAFENNGEHRERELFVSATTKTGLDACKAELFLTPRPVVLELAFLFVASFVSPRRVFRSTNVKTFGTLLIVHAMEFRVSSSRFVLCFRVVNCLAAKFVQVEKNTTNTESSRLEARIRKFKNHFNRSLGALERETNFLPNLSAAEKFRSNARVWNSRWKFEFKRRVSNFNPNANVDVETHGWQAFE